MSDGAFPDRVTLLRNRWDADPSSRVFLQLAEEYRHQGRVKEALDVLDRGLKEHAGYLSALVAKGRCHLELGEPEPARAVLERVVKQDATQMVAIKLLVRAYLETGEPERARERLDLYSLLNDSDPEIEELRRRLHAMEQPPQAEKPGPPPPPDSTRSEASPAAPPPREAAPSPAAGGDIFDLTYSARRSAARASTDEPFAELLAAPARTTAAVAAPAAAPAAMAAAAPSSAPVAVAEPVPEPEAVPEPETVAEPEEEAEPAGILFPGLASRESRRRYLASLVAEGLFLLDLTAEVAPPPAAPAAPVPVEEPAPEAFSPPPPPLPVEELEPAPARAAEPAPLAAVEAPPAPEAEPMATVTLGELYLKQGHRGEAERIFREILRREPQNPAAQQGLARAAAPPAEKGPLRAQELLAGYQPGTAGGEAETKARKAWVLNSYLKRLRRGSRRGVS